MKQERSIETQVVDAVLERKTESIVVGDREYTIAPPTLGTIIMISELVATLPKFNLDPEQDNLLQEVLKEARHTAILGRIVAILIMGAKRVLENRLVPKKSIAAKRTLSFFKRKQKETTTYIPEVDLLAEEILQGVSPATLSLVLNRRLIDMQISDFFVLTTSLTTTNHLKPTREVENPTASGD